MASGRTVIGKVPAGWSPWTWKLYQYALLVRLQRPIGILLLLWPALWALWIAGRGHPDPMVVAVFVTGVTLMRSAGCAINDYADRDFDPYVRRTRERPLATGRIAPREALAVFVSLSLAAFGLVLLTNRLTILMSFVGVLLAASYPFTKRHTHLPQVYLGIAFGWAVPMAFAAQVGGVPPLGWLIFLATVLWAVAYDTLYAMVDREDDRRIGVKSTALFFGRYDRLAVGLSHLGMLALLAGVGRTADLDWPYFAGLAAAAGLAAYQQHLARERSPEGCFRAFLNNNWLGAAVFAGTALSYV
jgi:4-hydroxybenzoate polyprenyltransferase